MKIKKHSFTLIEMLIVIVIIGILSAALIPRLQSIQARARDSKRKLDLTTIYNANEIYFIDNGVYPLDRYVGDSAQFRHSYDTGYWMPELSGILASIPEDPINQINLIITGNIHPWMTGSFSYTYHSLYTPLTGGANTYDLTTRLENPRDPDRYEVKGWKRNNDQNSYGDFGLGGNDVYDLSPNVKNQ